MESLSGSAQKLRPREAGRAHAPAEAGFVPGVTERRAGRGSGVSDSGRRGLRAEPGSAPPLGPRDPRRRSGAPRRARPHPHPASRRPSPPAAPQPLHPLRPPSPTARQARPQPRFGAEGPRGPRSPPPPLLRPPRGAPWARSPRCPRSRWDCGLAVVLRRLSRPRAPGPLGLFPPVDSISPVYLEGKPGAPAEQTSAGDNLASCPSITRVARLPGEPAGACNKKTQRRGFGDE